MDPIHPIAPLPPTLPPVAPAPMIGRIDRDSPRGTPEQQRRRRRPGQNPAGTDPDELGSATDERDGDDDSGLHINVTA
jgi:hypothetical protein